MGEGNRIPGGAAIYVMPTGFCDPSFDAPAAVLTLAGTAVCFSALRIIASEYGHRVFDGLVSLKDLDAFCAHLTSSQRQDIRATLDNIIAPRGAIALKDGRYLSFNVPLIMGILNVTPDSFSDGGKNFDPATAVAHGVAMAQTGAHILDVGGESTRPGAQAVWEGDEIARVTPVVEALASAGHIVSIDTRKAAVMQAALAAGAAIVNDVSALTHDHDALNLMARAECPIVLMHAQGDPATMQKKPAYDDALLDIYDWLKARIEMCRKAGIAHKRLIIDPGLGFGKTVRHNLELINGLGLFHGLGCPILFGASRKRFIGALTDVENAEKRLAGSLATALIAVQQGAHILRVHDVPETVQAMALWQGTRDVAMLPPVLGSNLP